MGGKPSMLAAAVALAFAGAPVSAQADRVTDVIVGDSYFDPANITVGIGTTIVWTHRGNLTHTVTADDGSFDSHPNCPQTSACMQSGDTYTRTFEMPGLVRYYCKIHGNRNGVGHAGVLNVVDPTKIPTTVDTLSAVATGTDVSVSGSASFGGQPPVLMAEDPPGDAPLVADLGDETGVDLLAGKISQPDPNVAELVFEWHLVALATELGPPPEVVRYNFPFKVGEKQFQLQAKLSNLVSSTLTDDPPGHVQHVGGSFQLRGNCAPQPVTGIISCPHIAWLEGRFDAARDIVQIRLPIGASFASEVVPGAVLDRNPVANGTIVAAYQAYVSNSSTWDEAVWEEGIAYTVPYREVLLGIAPAGTDPSLVEFSAAASLAADGSFSGSVSAPGPGSYDVWARACFATNCGTRMGTITT